MATVPDAAPLERGRTFDEAASDRVVGLGPCGEALTTWRTWGKGREVSRRLPDGALDAARRLADALLARPDTERWIQRGDRRARIVGPARDDGLRIDGGPDGFAERTVSLTDLAWVMQAADDIAHAGGLLDEARVNKLRYLDGTPKESTRWIDTGWAIAARYAMDRGPR